MPASEGFENILQECATEEAYQKACVRATGGSEFNPDALEPLCKELRTSRGRYLLRGDLDRFFEEGKTVYGHYWRLSKLKAWEDTAISLHESQCRKSGWKESIVQKLRAHLRRMEIVSVLLSCVYPEDFAVYSPPIMTILQVPPCPPIQHYLRYCEDIAKSYANGDATFSAQRASVRQIGHSGSFTKALMAPLRTSRPIWSTAMHTMTITGFGSDTRKRCLSPVSLDAQH